MMNLVSNNGGQRAARHRQVSGPARVGADDETDETDETADPTDPADAPTDPSALGIVESAPAAAQPDHTVSDPLDASLTGDAAVGTHEGRGAATPLPQLGPADHAPAKPAAASSDLRPDSLLTAPDQVAEPAPRRGRPTLAVIVAMPTIIVVILATLISLGDHRENLATEGLATEIGSAQEQYRASTDAERTVARARFAANQGVNTATEAALDRADLLLRRQSDALDGIVRRSEKISANNAFAEPLAGLLAADRSYLDVTKQLIDLSRKAPEAARETQVPNQQLSDQRLVEHDRLGRDLSLKLDRLTRQLDDRGLDATVLPLLPLPLAIIGFLLAWWAWRSISEPLRHVSQTLERVADGQFQARSNLAGHDDLARVGQATDALARQLGDRFSTLSEDARRNTQNRVISETLEIADSEAATFAVVEQALGLFAPGLAGELLLLDAESGELGEMAASPSAGSPGCPVTDPADCVALRRGQSTVFDSSESINGCPMLRNRPGGPVSALCVPMTFNSSPLGVIHLTGPSHQPPSGRASDQFVTLASQTATRIGGLRTLEQSRRQASTDGLTGLPNRQVIEASVAQLIARHTPFVVALADLDRFKSINDRFGHEAGDRALQTFAAVVSQNVRGADVVGRLGGDEFIIIYPELSVAAAIEAIERLRAALDDATSAGTFMAFTASFGVAHSAVGNDFAELVRLADAGLLLAKERGRDRAVAASPELVGLMFPPEGSTRK